MDLAIIKTLIETMEVSDLTEMEFHQDGWTLRLRRDGARRPAAAAPKAAPPLPASPAPERRASEPVALRAGDLEAPMSGVVHLHPAPGEPAFVTAGQAVKEGDIVCLVEAMKTFNTVRAERAGTVAAVLVVSGSDVEAGQVLMRIV